MNRNRLLPAAAVGAALAVVAGPIVLLMLLATTTAGTASQPAGQPAGGAGIPERLRAAYLDAAQKRCPGLDWTILAGVGQVESQHAAGAPIGPNGATRPKIIGPPLDGGPGVRRIPDSDGGRWDGDTELDRAVGPMQFLPSTWRTAGLDASGDNAANPHNVYDATHAAAAYLCQSGAPGDLRAALLAYNNSQAYVSDVLAAAEQIAAGGRVQLAGGAGVGVLDHPAITLYPAARRDFEAGIVNGRLSAMLVTLADRQPITVTVAKTGHSKYLAGTDTVSMHHGGDAVDIFGVAGQPVADGNTAARQLVDLLAGLPAGQRPEEVGSPWPAYSQLPGFFSDQAHQDHVHLGVQPKGE